MTRIKNLLPSLWYTYACLLAVGLMTEAVAQVSNIPQLAAPAAPVAGPLLRYTLAMPTPQTHYFEVTLELPVLDSLAYTDLKMPVWTPGSYLVREFERHVEHVQATAGSQALAVQKINKNTWRVLRPARGSCRVTYQVYAYEATVRTSYLDADYAFVAGTSVFLYPAGHQQLPSQVTVQPAAGWATVSTALPPVAGAGPYVYQAADYDELVDSPFEIGNHKVLSYVTRQTPHQVALYGPVKLPDEARFLADLQKITEQVQQVVGQNPLDRYLFLIEHNRYGSGGLEHRNCVAIGLTPRAYASPAAYLAVLQTAAHEYFHLWNGKRIRPLALGPFDYDQENYTNLLWLSEGQTDYIGSLVLARAGFYTSQQYFDHLVNLVTQVESQPGNREQSVAEASFDAWIGRYRDDENSPNSQADYYQKGELIGLLLDLQLIAATNGHKHLDDVFRLLYARYYVGLHRGFTDQEYQDAVTEVAGRPFADFFQRYVYGTAPLDYAPALAAVGLTLTSTPALPAGSLGATIRYRNGRYVVTFVAHDGPAWRGGLNVDDELQQLNGQPLTEQSFQQLLVGAVPGTTLTLRVQHNLTTHDLRLTVAPNPEHQYAIRPEAKLTRTQQQWQRKWLDR